MIIWIITGISIADSLTACDGSLRHSLEMAGDNREELEKVMKHFKHDPDPLKLKAAEFLIENMPYHYSFEGKGIERYDSAYLVMAGFPYQKRDSVFSALSRNFDFSDAKGLPDVLSLKAEFLIKAIDDACASWHKSSWCRDYSEDIFFDYVLPYRLSNEQISDWHDAIDTEFPYLKSNYITSRRGLYLEAENVSHRNGRVLDFSDASQGKLLLLEKKDDAVDFTVNTPIESEKQIWLRYNSGSTAPMIRVKINGLTVGEYRLEPTVSQTALRDSRFGIAIPFAAGENTLTIENIEGSVGLDRIMISAVESIGDSDGEDFSGSLYRIRNNATNNYLVFDTLRNELLNLVRLSPANDRADSCSMLRLDFKGENSWSISSFKRDTADLCLEVRYCATEERAPMSQYIYQGGNHQKWIFIPEGDGSFKIMGKDSGLFLEASKDDDDNEIIIQTQYAGRDSQKWIMESCGVNTSPNPRYPFGSAVGAAMKVHYLMSQFEWMEFRGNVPPKMSSLMKGRTGNCLNEACYTVGLCRHIGIPAAIDFAPSYANRSRGHSWSVLINPDGTSTLFHMGFAPGDSVYYVKNYIRPKIYRRHFSLNRQIADDLKEENEVPKLFRNPTFTDVTNEYGEVTDIVRSVPDDVEGKVAYICVFDNKEWVPVDYGVIKNRKVTFKSMGRNVAYISAVFKNGRIVSFGNPFIVSDDGSVRNIMIDETDRQNMTLLRKYPFMSYNEDFNRRLDGGKFEAANSADFSDAIALYTHTGLTDGNWYEVEVNERGRHRFVRYIGKDGSYCNINEIEFIDDNGNKLHGEIIGSKGIEGKEKEKVFDSDILTGFEGNSPDGHWIGMKLTKPEHISRIRYIPRTDGNCIEIGDEYELLYWKDSHWNSMGKIKATRNSLEYDNVPQNGLYLLRDLTKGEEERIFIYEDGKQIWW